MGRKHRPTPARESSPISHPRAPGNSWVLFSIVVFLGAIVWLGFGETLHHGFVNYDDDEYLYRNPHVAGGLTVDGVIWAFTSARAANWHPLTWLSHMLDCQIYGLHPAGHHFTNVLFHALTVIALFFVLRQLTNALWPSAFVAALFAIHPLRVESVAWVAERKDVLSGLFFMLTIGAYIRYVRAPWSPLRYGLVVVFFVLGLLCKSMLVSLPFVLLLLDYWPLERFPSPQQDPGNYKTAIRRLILEKLPLFGLSLAVCVITVLTQRSAMQSVKRMSLPMRLGNALVSYTDYLAQMFWPKDLAVLYPWEAIRLGPFNVVSSIVVLGGISAITLILRRQRYLLTGWLWYLVMLVPVIGILQVGNQARADRYTYLPQIGIYLMITWGAIELCQNLPKRRVLLPTLGLIIIGCLLLVTRTQATYWHDSESLWSHTVSCTTQNTVAEGMIASALAEKGKTHEAITHFENALAIEPKQPSIHAGLGAFYLELGQVNESLDHLQKALALEPNDETAHYNLGNTYLQMGRLGDAVSQYQKAVETNPDNVEALNNLAWILSTSSDSQVRDGPRAVTLADHANSVSGGTNPLVIKTLAAAYAESGRFSEAISTAQRAAELATEQGDTARAESIRKQLETYRLNSPFRGNR